MERKRKGFFDKTITLKELIKQLSELPLDQKVNLQIDPEGNGYRSVRGAETVMYIDEGECFSLDWSADDAGMEEEWIEFKQSTEKVVVIYP